MCLRATVQTESVQGRMDLLESILPWTCKAFFEGSRKCKDLPGRGEAIQLRYGQWWWPSGELFSLLLCGWQTTHGHSSLALAIEKQWSQKNQKCLVVKVYSVKYNENCPLNPSSVLLSNSCELCYHSLSIKAFYLCAGYAVLAFWRTLANHISIGCIPTILALNY